MSVLGQTSPKKEVTYFSDQKTSLNRDLFIFPCWQRRKVHPSQARCPSGCPGGCRAQLEEVLPPLPSPASGNLL